MAKNPYADQFSWTYGKSKCTHCGSYEDDNVIAGHEASCHMNPANRED